MIKAAFTIFMVLFLSGRGLADGVNVVQTEVLAKTTQSWNGAPLPAYPAGTPEITVLRIRIPPGVQLPLHKHPVINAGVMLKGELTVVTEDGKTLHLQAGDAIVEVVEKWHHGKNEGMETAEIVVFYAGALGTPVTIKE